MPLHPAMSGSWPFPAGSPGPGSAPRLADPPRPRPAPLWPPPRPGAASSEPAAMRAAGSGDSAEAAAEQPWKKFVYVEPSRRVKEILEEELYIQEEAWRVKHPAAVAVEGIWSLKKNFNIGSLKPVSQNRNGLLLQPQFYSRHAGRKNC
ncbi:uncharacterized protein C11orf97 homolog [Cuculus canorus]|uniref:uncharacterized protein C11orf97 homolog n=1 Tax=Cuculus canorus TaxID=55661 RepID=UPI0023AA69D2|nr:uncharacterized protein C11orf97 homolog [Cuculus canorus]